MQKDFRGAEGGQSFIHKDGNPQTEEVKNLLAGKGKPWDPSRVIPTSLKLNGPGPTLLKEGPKQMQGSDVAGAECPIAIGKPMEYETHQILTSSPARRESSPVCLDTSTTKPTVPT